MLNWQKEYLGKRLAHFSFRMIVGIIGFAVIALAAKSVGWLSDYLKSVVEFSPMINLLLTHAEHAILLIDVVLLVIYTAKSIRDLVGYKSVNGDAQE